MSDHEDLKHEVSTRAVEAIRQVTTRVANLFEFTCGAGDWALTHDGVNFFLVNLNDDDDVLEVRIKVNVEIVE